jgi:heme exporter protein A
VALFAAAVRQHLSQGGSALMATHIDLGLEARLLDISPYRARPGTRAGTSDEAFL